MRSSPHDKTLVHSWLSKIKARIFGSSHQPDLKTNQEEVITSVATLIANSKFEDAISLVESSSSDSQHANHIYTTIIEPLLHSTSLYLVKDFCDALLAAKPNSTIALRYLARIHELTSDFEIALLYWNKLRDRNPKSKNALKGALRCLIAEARQDEARQVLTDHKQFFGMVDYELLRLDFALHDWKYSEALLNARALYQEYPTSLPVILKLVDILFAQKTRSHLEEARSLLEECSRKHENSYPLQLRLAKCYCFLNDIDAVRTYEQTLHHHHNPQISQSLQSWLCHRDKNYERSTELFRTSVADTFIPAIHAKKSELKLLSTQSLFDIAENQAVVVSPMRNEGHILDEWIDYYQSIGIDWIVIIDNGSTDNTTEILRTKNNIIHLYTEDSYRAAAHSMRWVNQIVESLPDNCWCLFADADEFFVAPAIETRGIRPLLNYMDNNKHEAMIGFMLDMHPATFNDEKPAAQSARSTYSYFTNTYETYGNISPPYQDIRGGIRQLYFEHHFPLTKIPLLKTGRGIQYTTNHTISPSVFSDVTGLFLHYKFGFSFKDKAEIESRRNEQIRGGFTHKKYSEVFASLSQDDEELLSSNAILYKDSEQLIELGLIECTDVFRKSLDD